ncbi:hypothetical protein HPB51_000130 [Rhipicephalus microplus]|uniref:Uncharacterized protein n=1 Tax=Rhipicephalus microplus TaxID=6941 RepID=A0A9J6DS21_RHIMP|nr:hypothetical protein HPB51_000130 [Rhipicephalus microplus]
MRSCTLRGTTWEPGGTTCPPLKEASRCQQSNPLQRRSSQVPGQSAAKHSHKGPHRPPEHLLIRRKNRQRNPILYAPRPRQPRRRKSPRQHQSFERQRRPHQRLGEENHLNGPETENQDIQDQGLYHIQLDNGQHSPSTARLLQQAGHLPQRTASHQTPFQHPGNKHLLLSQKGYFVGEIVQIRLSCVSVCVCRKETIQKMTIG